NPEALHTMLQLWDGRGQLFQSQRETLEGTIYYDLNAWSPDFGHIKVYRAPVVLMDTGLTLAPDTAWHRFELVVDFTQRTYVRLGIDGRYAAGLTGISLAHVPQPTWGREVAMSLTTESLAAWPQANCPLVFTWATQYRNVKLEGLP